MVATVTIVLATLLGAIVVGGTGYVVYRQGHLRGQWSYRNSEYVVDYRDIDAHERHEAAAASLSHMREASEQQGDE